jgi:hypothetical protein
VVVFQSGRWLCEVLREIVGWEVPTSFVVRKLDTTPISCPSGEPIAFCLKAPIEVNQGLLYAEFPTNSVGVYNFPDKVDGPLGSLAKTSASSLRKSHVAVAPDNQAWG